MASVHPTAWDDRGADLLTADSLTMELSPPASFADRLVTIEPGVTRRWLDAALPTDLPDESSDDESSDAGLRPQLHRTEFDVAQAVQSSGRDLLAEIDALFALLAR